MKKRIAIFLAIIMIAAVLCTVLVACGNDNSDPNTIKFFTYAPKSNKALKEYKSMIQRFTNETGIKVNATYVFKDDYNNKLNTNMMNDAKDQADVFLLDQPMLGTYVEHCLNLDEGFFAADEEEGVHLSDFFDVAVETAKYEGSIYAVPYSLTSCILLYNKDLVSSVPQDWDEWRNMTVQNGNALFGGIGVDGYASWAFQAFLKSAGGDMIKDNKIVFNNEAGVRAGQMLQDLYGKSDKDIRDSSNAFVNGKIMFVMAHNNDIYTYFSTSPQFSESKLGATLFIPETKNGTSYSNIGGENFAINKNSKNIEACKQLVKFLLREENVNIAIESNFSAVKAYAKVRTKDPITGVAYSQALQDTLKVVLEQLETATARPTIKNWMKVNDRYLADALKDITANNKNVKDALDEAYDISVKNLEL